jgi:hypothetical protein
MLEATFHKLRDGSWALKVEGRAKAGDWVRVEKSNGSSETFKLTELAMKPLKNVWFFLQNRNPQEYSAFAETDGKGNWYDHEYAHQYDEV